MSDDTSNSVTLTKMCELHGIDLQADGAVVERFRKAFPAAEYDDEAGEWRMVWKKGSYADSNARLVAFFDENGVAISHVDKC